MNELTLEQKAKAYDKALEKFDVILNLNTVKESGTIFADDVRKIFPELKESEDEKIKQKIIKLVKMSNKVGGFALHKCEADEMIAWLEKQGEQILANSAKICKDEQKPAENVEPKFKVGEWIISRNKKSTYQVIEVKRGIYVIRDNADNHEYHIGIEECEKSASLWNISDAKDGDVLASEDKDKVFLYNGKHDLRGDVCAYYGIYKTYDGIRFTKVAIGNSFTYKEPHPATKEQRDRLEKAMADAGYTFDFEKKELKKIEDETEIPFGATDSELHEVTYYIPKDFHAEIDDDKVVIKKGEEFISWSVEDALRLEEVICMTEANGRWVRSDDAVKSVLDWLKSLKDRVSKFDDGYKVGFSAAKYSQWKPSDGQISLLQAIINDPNNAASESCQIVLKEVIKQLKKLREE